MDIPNFLGIGVPKAGTTWLYELLMAHPEAYVPAKKKEVHFFDNKYERGLAWYYGLFPNQEMATKYKAIGELTPTYLFHPDCPERISRFSDSMKLVLILRNPLDRLYSHYIHHIRVCNFKGNFSEFVSSWPEGLNNSLYSKHIHEYLKYFKREQLLVLIFEQSVQKVESVKQALASHLGLDATLFPEDSGSHKVYPRFLPRFGFLYALAVKVNYALRWRDLDIIPILAKRLGLKKVFGTRDMPIPTMDLETYTPLRALFLQDICDLESVLNINLQEWKVKIEAEGERLGVGHMKDKGTPLGTGNLPHRSF